MAQLGFVDLNALMGVWLSGRRALALATPRRQDAEERVGGDGGKDRAMVEAWHRRVADDVAKRARYQEDTILGMLGFMLEEDYY